MRSLALRGARTNNLKNLDLDLEPGSLVVLAGPSGSGKSSLAFSTLYAEGQRRYVESFSAYARQFLERLSRPPVDELEPVAAGIAVDRQAPIRTSRSTVGTMTEIADYAKSLWARAADLYCPSCDHRVERDSPESATNVVLADASGSKIVITYPIEITSAEHFLEVREGLVGAGYRRIWLGEEARDLDSVPPSAVLPIAAKKRGRKKEGAPLSVLLNVIVDRTTATATERSRLVEAIEAAMDRSGGRADVRKAAGGMFRFSTGLHCPRCDRSFREPIPAMFSFNNPIGACDSCRGFGRTIGIDLDRIVPDRSLSLAAGAVRAFSGKKAGWERRRLIECAESRGVPIDRPVSEFSGEEWNWLVEGEGKGFRKAWFGIRPWFQWLESRAYKMHIRVFLARYRKYETCEACQGTRLKPEGRFWRIGEHTLPSFFALEVSDALALVEVLLPRFSSDPATVLVLEECANRLRSLVEVGLGYLSLDRASRTLSGGEAQRVSLTSALGSSLNGAMFVLDEPTVGLHPSDVERLFAVVRRLAHGDNIVLVVEHDLHVIGGADRVVELGPGAGDAGGNIVFDGEVSALRRADTPTALALRGGGQRSIATPAARNSEERIVLRGARGNNLKNVDLAIPRAALTCVTGVSGSGKSSLIVETLYPALAQRLGQGGADAPLAFDALDGLDGFDRAVLVDQAPLGRTSRGNPATYMELWDAIRKRFAATPIAKSRGYKPGFFSFNVEGGRCETCKGQGAETVEMQFLADVTFQCPDCQGHRFRGPVLEVLLDGLSIADVLELTVDAAHSWFSGPGIEPALRALSDVGLGYLRLGQPLNTLSGGEAQRLKLAAALADVGNRRSIVILDEPTAGLHAGEVDRLIVVLRNLVVRGDTVIAIEHDMSVAAASDHVIDIGPGAGARGGTIVATGTPDEVSMHGASVTAAYLRAELRRETRGIGPQVRRIISSSSTTSSIEILGAREHNLKDVTVEIPRERLVVVTGPSGSGKSTLAFDVLFAEGQRRYLETLTPYARQYMPQLPRPVVDRIAGLPPCVSLEQRMTRGGRNSTVATVTEIAHYLRVLWARAGVLSCPACKIPIEPSTPPQILADLRSRFSKRAEALLLAPVVHARKGQHRELLARLRKRGYRAARIDGAWIDLKPGLTVSRYEEHDIDCVIGRIELSDSDFEARLREALEHGDGVAKIRIDDVERTVSSRRACPSCSVGYPELDPRFFSFNTRQGACEACDGAGVQVRTIGRGANAREEESMCMECSGSRISPLARSVALAGLPITAVTGLSITEARARLQRLDLNDRARTVGEAPLGELDRRLSFLEEIGLSYLGLDRSANTLSGGELQRVRLAAQLGSGLTGILYVLDEPTIGLHPRDTGRLVAAMRRLVEKGNTVLVVEHDLDTIRAADHVIDMGPGGGREGGSIVAAAAPAELARIEHTPTGVALRMKSTPPAPQTGGTEWLTLRGASHHNLKDIDVAFPLGRLTAVTGVSGSGKSSLVREVLLRAVRTELGLVTPAPGPYRSLEGLVSIQRAVEVDQSPIGRTPRSVPATYVGIWDLCRKLLAGTPEARARGYRSSRFSFNTVAGRCATCEGQGALRIEMAFLPDVHVACESCRGLRFSPETLQVKLHGLNAGEILGLDVRDAVHVFANVAQLVAPLETMNDLGLGYLKLGQASNTLSGGEAQRLKLVAELRARAAGPSLFVMDEPTTGLHRSDVIRLLGVIRRLVDRGDTVVVIEHHPDVILAADWVIDLGPEAGSGGGEVVAVGPPAVIMASSTSHTGLALRLTS